jgi:NADH dehydrogenase [ubiquinone] 1 alpha subcomplex assembly factor 6
MLNVFRKYDSPSYTLSHFIKPHMLPAYMAIRAFNIEVARIPDIVSNAAIGSMRMQFWRQTIDATFEQRPPEEPVAVLLASYLAQGHRLSKLWFHRIINTRDGKLSHPGFIDLGELESYAENTYSTLLYLTLSALPMQSVTMDHLASHIGKATGIAAVLRGVPLLAFPPPPNTHSANPPGLGLSPNRERQGVIALPLDVMSQCGVREEDIFRQGGQANGIRDAVFDIATRASDHLITARTMAKSARNDSYPDHEFEHIKDETHVYEQPSTDTPAVEFRDSYGVLMGPALSTQLWLNRLEKVDFDIFHSSLRAPEWSLPIKAWWHSRKLRL